jgi:hypothetical protein
MKHGEKSGKQRMIKDFIVLSLTGDSVGNGVVKVMRNNGFVLSYIASLLNKYPNQVYVWVADRITLHQFPELCKKGGLWLSQGSRNLRYLPKNLGITKEVLEKCKINYLLNLKE